MKKNAQTSLELAKGEILVISAWLKPDDFYLEKHDWIYEAMLACYQRRVPPDIAMVADELRRADRLDLVGGILYLGELTADVPTAVHVEHYGRIVKRTALCRQIIEVGGHISALGYEEHEQVSAMLTQVTERLKEIDATALVPATFGVAELMQWDIPPVKWYIPGVLSEGFGYIAAQPGTGKTWMLLQSHVSLVPTRFDHFFMASQSGLAYLVCTPPEPRTHHSQADVTPRPPNYRNEGDSDGKLIFR